MNDDELRRRMDRMATEAPDPADRRDRVLSRARRRERLGVVAAGIGAIAVGAVVIVALSAVMDRPGRRIANPPAPTGTVRPEPTGSPAPLPRVEGEIAFWSDSRTGGSARLALMAADGSQRTDVIDLAISTSRLSWSPDGMRAVFDHGTGAGSGQLDVMDFETGRVETIFVVGDPQSPDWSPDGERIVFNTDSAALFTIPAGGASGGRAIRQLGRNEYLEGLHPTWSPDGREIAYVDWRSGTISIIAVAGDTLARELPSPGGIGSLDWGRDGLVVSGTDGGGSSLFLVDPEGIRPAIRLTEQPGDEIEPSISPDGRFVTFVGNAEGQQDVYVLRMADRHITRLTHDERPDRSPAWRPTAS